MPQPEKTHISYKGVDTPGRQYYHVPSEATHHNTDRREGNAMKSESSGGMSRSAWRQVLGQVEHVLGTDRSEHVGATLEELFSSCERMGAQVWWGLWTDEDLGQTVPPWAVE